MTFLETGTETHHHIAMMADSDADRLPTLMQTLPAELFNKIHDLTFSPPSHDIAVTLSHRPPTQLRIDRASRARFAKTYYAACKFVATDMDVVVHWLRSLSVEHLGHLQNVELICRSDAGSQTKRTMHRTLHDLGETVCSGHSDNGFRWGLCTFLRVRDVRTGVRTIPLTEVKCIQDGESFRITCRTRESFVLHRKADMRRRDRTAQVDAVECCARAASRPGPHPHTAFSLGHLACRRLRSARSQRERWSRRG